MKKTAYLNAYFIFWTQGVNSYRNMMKNNISLTSSVLQAGNDTELSSIGCACIRCDIELSLAELASGCS